MKSIKEISAEIQELCVHNISDTEVLKEVFSLLKDIENKKAEVVSNITDLANDYNEMAHQIEVHYEDDATKSDEYITHLAKRDAVRTCIKMLEEL